MKKNILLVGGGGHCCSVIDVLISLDIYRIYGVIDTKANVGKNVMGYKVIGCDDDLHSFKRECSSAIVTVGHIWSCTLRAKLFNLLRDLKYELPTIISPLAYVSPSATVGRGTVVMHHALINACAQIGENCIINSKALVEHHVKVGSNCHISTASVLNGGAEVYDGIFYGSNSVCKNHTKVSLFTKAGTVVK